MNITRRNDPLLELLSDHGGARRAGRACSLCDILRAARPGSTRETALFALVHEIGGERSLRKVVDVANATGFEALSYHAARRHRAMATGHLAGVEHDEWVNAAEAFVQSRR